MMFSFAIIATVNLLLGLLVGLFLSPANDFLSAGHGLIPRGWFRRGEPAGTVADRNPDKMAPRAAVAALSSDSAPSPHQARVIAAQNPPSAKPGDDKSHMEAAHELHQIGQRLQYCRVNRDKALLKQVAAQLLDWSAAWQAQLHRWIESAETAPPEVSAGDCLELEMQAAQSETTQSNLQSIDWADNVEDLVRQLEREIESLDRNQHLKKLAANFAAND
jgi:hypothetical protein